MPLPNGGSGRISRQIERQMPAASAIGAVIGLYLVNVAADYVAYILRFAFSHPYRMYQVGYRVWGLLALIAFAQGVFQIGGSVMTHPTLMFLVLAVMFTMYSQMSAIESLHNLTHEHSDEHREIFFKNAMEVEIAIVAMVLWGCVALAIWWSPNVTEIFGWFGLGKLSAQSMQYWYCWTVIFFLQIVVGSYGLKFLITLRVNKHIRKLREWLNSSGDKYSAEERAQIDEAISVKLDFMKSELRAVMYANGAGFAVFAASMVAGVYWLIIWYFHDYHISWAVL